MRAQGSNFRVDAARQAIHEEIRSRILDIALTQPRSAPSSSEREPSQVAAMIIGPRAGLRTRDARELRPLSWHLRRSVVEAEIQVLHLFSQRVAIEQFCTQPYVAPLLLEHDRLRGSLLNRRGSRLQGTAEADHRVELYARTYQAMVGDFPWCWVAEVFARACLADAGLSAAVEHETLWQLGLTEGIGAYGAAIIVLAHCALRG
jgi:hypothetical protein